MLPQHLHALRPVIMRCKVVYGFELLPEDGGVAVYGGGWWMVVCHCGGVWWWLGGSSGGGLVRRCTDCVQHCGQLGL